MRRPLKVAASAHLMLMQEEFHLSEGNIAIDPPIR